jgi:hypothetical protein
MIHRYSQFYSQSHVISEILIGKDHPNIMLNDDFFNGYLPTPIRIADLNNDGYPDFVFLHLIDGRADRTAVAYFESIACDDGCSTGAKLSNRRMFRKALHGTQDLDSLLHPINVGVLDFNNDVSFGNIGKEGFICSEDER